MPISFRLVSTIVCALAVQTVVVVGAHACDAEPEATHAADHPSGLNVSQDLSRLFELVEREA